MPVRDFEVLLHVVPGRVPARVRGALVRAVALVLGSRFVELVRRNRPLSPEQVPGAAQVPGFGGGCFSRHELAASHFPARVSELETALARVLVRLLESAVFHDEPDAIERLLLRRRVDWLLVMADYHSKGPQ